MANIPERQQRRAEFLIELLHTEEAKNLLKRKGITDHSFIKRLCSNLREYGSIVDAPRSGRDPKYTDELLAAAMEFMLESLDCVWSKQCFVDSLIAEGVLEDGVSIEGFWRPFAAYMQQHGMRMVYGTQRLTFAMSGRHADGRLTWCRDNEGVLTHETVREYWFTDEIQLEHGPPPNSECLPCPAALIQSCNVACLQWCLLACIPVGCNGCQRQLCMHATSISSWLS